MRGRREHECRTPPMAPDDDPRNPLGMTSRPSHAAIAATGTARVVIVDDHHAVRAGLRAVLQAEPGLDPVGVTGTAREALALVDDLRPDVVVLDYHLPDEHGLSLCLRLKGAEPAPAALI